MSDVARSTQPAVTASAGFPLHITTLADLERRIALTQARLQRSAVALINAEQALMAARQQLELTRERLAASAP